MPGIAFLPTVTIRVSPAPEILARGSFSAATADFNRDGKADLVMTVPTDREAPASFVYVLLGSSAGLSEPTPYRIGSPAYRVAVGDFDGDARLDLAVTELRTCRIPPSSFCFNLEILPGDGLGVFGPPMAHLIGLNPNLVASAFFDQDNRSDLAKVELFCDFNCGDATTHLQTAIGEFRDVGRVQFDQNPTDIAVADFNGDGMVDVALGFFEGLAVSLGRGGGELAPAPRFGTFLGNVWSLAIGDFNEDGNRDILSVGFRGAFHAGNGSGNFAPPSVLPGVSGGSGASAPTADIDADSHLDLIVVTGFSGLTIFRGDGRGGFQSAADVSVGPDPKVVAGDFDANDRTDLATINRDGTVSLLRNVSPGALAFATGPQLPDAAVGEPYQTTLIATGGRPSYAFAPYTPLPPGLSLTPSGLLSGIPVGTGTFSFTIQLSDFATVETGFSVLRDFRLQVRSALSIVPLSLPPDARPGAPYSGMLQATGGTLPLTWSVVSGALPPGLVLSSDGRVSGTPTFAGRFQFRVRVTDATGRAAEADVRFRVFPRIRVIPPRG